MCWLIAPNEIWIQWFSSDFKTFHIFCKHQEAIWRISVDHMHFATTFYVRDQQIELLPRKMINEIKGSWTRTQEEKKKIPCLQLFSWMELKESHYFSRLIPLLNNRLKATVLFLWNLKWVGYHFLNQSFSRTQKQDELHWVMHSVEGSSPTWTLFLLILFFCKRIHNDIKNLVISRVNSEYLPWVLIAIKSLISSLRIHTK